MIELISVTPVDTGKTLKDYNEAFFNKLYQEMRRLYSECMESGKNTYRRPAFSATIPSIVNDTMYLVIDGSHVSTSLKGTNYIVIVTLNRVNDVCYGVDVSLDHFMPKSTLKNDSSTAIEQTLKFGDFANKNPVLHMQKNGLKWVLTKAPKGSSKSVENEEFDEIYTAMADCILKLMNLLYTNVC